MPYLTTKDGTEIFYKDWGTGMPVILIHGWPLNSDSWEHQASFLALNGYRVIAYDRRGFGRSSQPFQGYDYNTLSDDLADLMTALDLRHAALVGFSMGGGEVVRYLSRHGSARVAKAVLISAVPPMMLKTDSNPDGVEAAQLDKIMDGLKKDRFDFFHSSFFPQFYGRSAIHHTVSESVLEWSEHMAMLASPKAILDCATSFGTTDFREEMKRLTTPFLIIHGTSDKTVPIDASGRHSAKILPHATLIEYDGEPHGLNATAPDRLNADLLHFLGGDHNTVPKMEQI